MDRLSPPRGQPEIRVLRVGEDLSHVVAGAEAELLERGLKRRRTGPAEAGPYDLHRELTLRRMNRRTLHSFPSGGLTSSTSPAITATVARTRSQCIPRLSDAFARANQPVSGGLCR